MSSGTFEMTGGTISGNTASGNGGGVCINSARFTMRGGTITGNTAINGGGGVYLGGRDYILLNFTKTGGTITGYSSDPNDGNAVRDEAGNVLARSGHAVRLYVGANVVLENRRRENTAGPGVNLSYSRSGSGSGTSGGWEE